MRRTLAFVLAVAAPGSLAAAQDGSVLSVEVGEQVELDVRNAIGWFCDDPSLVSATLVTRDGLNYWVVVGVSPGATQCRVGTELGRASYVFDVTVKPLQNGASEPVR